MNPIELSKLIIKHIKGKISEEEREFLDSWRNKKKHAELMEELTDINQVSKELCRYSSFRKDETWLKVEKRINPQRKVATGLNYLIRVAAVVLLIVSVKLSMQLFISESTDESFMSNKTIKAGDFKAVLKIDGSEDIIIRDTLTYDVKRQESLLAKIDKGQLVYENNTSITPSNIDIQVPERSEFMFTLSDGSVVWLNAGSRLTLQQPFSDDKRNVILEGEAYFEVKHDSDRPFTVNVPGENSIRVLGTSFNVNAYLTEKIFHTVLVEGSVLWKTKGGQERILEPEQLLSYEVNGTQIDVKSVRTENYTAWKDGRFVFDGEPLFKIMQSLSRWYGVDVNYLHPKIKDIPFSMDVEKYEDLNTILEMFEYTQKAKFDINDKGVVTVSKFSH
ncbi:FecR family protein [Carboxylicivirga marina]|uniref:DUF4974 domain-containing protein n=1 Tax=Carboxylicivirga marina TaxID=2800988 RepID=A0ABS1HH49_9BACT|nr:FecR family protein [Carboxylicivirga marina]MBK3516987.1 DUF4974 domain-containing protein [Carboxylicivirga marina]